MPIYNDEDISRSFKDIDSHKKTSDIIIAHSTNKKDIRELALENIDFSKIKNILDIGCGFGFFTAKLGGKIKKGTHILGLDSQDEYQKPFLKTCKDIGAIGEFHASDAAELAAYPPHTFDLVISSFSLYFFPNVIENIPKILTKKGFFIAITHSKNSLAELIRHIPTTMKSFGIKAPEILCIEKLFDQFSLENGKVKLSPHFGKIKILKHKNRLVFNSKGIKNIEVYLKMKKHLLLKEIAETEPDSLGAAVEHLMLSLAGEVRAKKKLTINKDDAIFICEKPKLPKKKIAQPRINRFCSFCGNRLTEKLIEDKKRGICSNCGYIAYENPLPVVAAVVVNEKNEVLLVKRARNPMKGMWCLPTGFAEADEHIEEAVIRELKEEAGIKGKVERLLDADTSHNYFYGNLLMISFEIKKIGGKMQAGSDSEDVKFFPTDKLPTLAFPSQEKVIEKLQG